MPFALLLALAAIAGGALVTYFYDRGAPLLVRLCAGACTGFAALALVGFVVASFTGMTPAALVVAGLVVALPLILLRRAEWRERLRTDARETGRALRQAVTFRGGGATLIFYAAAAFLCWNVFAQAMYAGADGIVTGLDNNIGDLPFHTGIITGFVHGDNFPPEHPEFAGARLTYPFIADFLTAMFVRAGATLEGAMFWQNFVLALSFIALLHRWAAELTRDRVAAFLTPALVLFNGGFGFWNFFREASQQGRGVFESLAGLSGYYTMAGETYKWGNAVAMLLVPQRGLLLGFPLAIIVWTIWWQATEEKANGKRQKAKVEAAGTGRLKKSGKGKDRREGKGRRGVVRTQTPDASESEMISNSSAPFPFSLFPFSFRQMFAAGAFAGLLPLVHAHSFVVLMAMGGCLAVLFSLRGPWSEDGGDGSRGWLRPQWRAWAVFFAVALVVAVPQMLWATYRSDVQAGSFFGWHVGWDRGKQGVVAFWLKNTGLFIPLLVAALAWRGRDAVVPRRLLMFFLPFVLCFVVPNLFKLSPWVWDNIKILFYWWMASAPLVALLVARLWRRGAALRAVACGLVAALTLAGALDVWRVASGAMRQVIFTRDGAAFAELVKRETGPRSLILHAPTYNHPVYLTGRRSLMGYAGHLSSHGIDYAARERDVVRIYAGAAGADELLRKYGVEYIVVGPLEMRSDEMTRLRASVNEAFLQRYKKVGQAGGYSLYKTSP